MVTHLSQQMSQTPVHTILTSSNRQLKEIVDNRSHTLKQLQLIDTLQSAKCISLQRQQGNIDQGYSAQFNKGKKIKSGKPLIQCMLMSGSEKLDNIDCFDWAHSFLSIYSKILSDDDSITVRGNNIDNLKKILLDAEIEEGSIEREFKFFLSHLDDCVSIIPNKIAAKIVENESVKYQLESISTDSIATMTELRYSLSCIEPALVIEALTDLLKEDDSISLYGDTVGAFQNKSFPEEWDLAVGEGLYLKAYKDLRKYMPGPKSLSPPKLHYLLLRTAINKGEITKANFMEKYHNGRIIGACFSVAGYPNAEIHTHYPSENDYPNMGHVKPSYQKYSTGIYMDGCDINKECLKNIGDIYKKYNEL